MAIQLQRSGISYVILEKANEVGGTWFFNQYPGCACDIPSHLYSFSFEPNPSWSRAYPTQPEILDYLKHCARKYNLYEHIQFNSEVISSTWDSESSKWNIMLQTGQKVEANVAVSGQGVLHVPNYPAFPDLAKFEGKILHTAEWDTSYDLQGKRIGIIGSAASAIQAIPKIAKQAARLFVFQRTPNWVVPKIDGPYSSWAKHLLRVPLCSSILRSLYYWRQESIYFLIFQNPELLSAKLLRGLLKRLIKRQVKDKALAEKLTPSYHVGCKRILISNDFYPALCKENVSVEKEPIARIIPNGIVMDHNGEARTIELDAIAFATGFQVMVGFPPIHGLDKKDLITEVWGSTPAAYLGLTVPGFPNFFFLLGPNTALGHNSVVWMIECQVNYIIKIIHRMLERNFVSVDTNKNSFDEYQQNISESLSSKVWSRNYCNSWYQNENGTIFTLWPSSTLSYWKSTLQPVWEHFIFS
uniref:Uncharacterized protein n=1 Tax=Vannella robusta TaxID=1487602 RepID=A0A7S4I9N8_9EUKA